MDKRKRSKKALNLSGDFMNGIYEEKHGPGVSS